MTVSSTGRLPPTPVRIEPTPLVPAPPSRPLTIDVRLSGGTMDASNILKPAIASGKLRCIGSTTYAEYKASFERDPRPHHQAQRGTRKDRQHERDHGNTSVLGLADAR